MMSTKTKNGKSKELPGMPELDTAGKLATRLMEVNEQIAEGFTSREEIEKELIEALIATGRQRIKVGDCLFIVKETEAKTCIRVLKDKKTKRGKSEADKDAA